MQITVKMPDEVARQWGETPDAVGRHVIHAPRRIGQIGAVRLENARRGGEEAIAGHGRLFVVAGHHDIGRQKGADRADQVRHDRAGSA